MVLTIRGNLVIAKVEALVNPVNCVGIMGTGLALQFKKRFLDNFLLYEQECKHGRVKIGKMYVTTTRKEKPKFIINFPTKAHWIDTSKLEYITSGLLDLVRVVDERKIKSIVIPMLGCGMGKLDWRIVRPHIENAFSTLPDVTVGLYVPQVR